MAELLQSLRQSRRGLVGLVGAALVGIERGADEVLGATSGKKIFVFNPEWGAGQTGCPATKAATHRKGGGCHGCQACHNHARNKRFATLDAVRRAHRRCHCKIETRVVTNQEFVKMFGKPGSANFRKEFDLRW